MGQKQKKPDGKMGPAIDWREVRQRLQTTADLLNRGMSSKERKALLKTRARALALEPLGQVTEGASLVVLEFRLASETYAMELCWVRETLPLKDLTPVPCTPPFVLGLINVRGEIISVINIGKFFDLPEKGLTDLNKVIILSGEGMEFGVLADAIVGVRSISQAELQAPLPTLTGVREEYLKGVTRERTIILDGKKLLSDGNIVVRE